jgi:basic membrane lipoprotein Med (substrate-binding protein (PBP1-ABC) superfamily)
MRTITNKLQKRLVHQAEEAKFLGFDKVASSVAVQVNGNETRDNEEDYVYSRQDLISDVERLIWAAAVRTQDYFNKTADVRDVNDVVESLAEELVDAVQKKIGGNVVGPYEPLVPGEVRNTVEIEDDE